MLYYMVYNLYTDQDQKKLLLVHITIKRKQINIVFAPGRILRIETHVDQMSVYESLMLYTSTRTCKETTFKYRSKTIVIVLSVLNSFSTLTDNYNVHHKCHILQM